MSQNHGFRSHGRRQMQNKGKQILPEMLDSSPLLKQFRVYAEELDDKNDRYERIIKLSRDINIESKRIIFLLHTIEGRKNNRASVLSEAIKRLNNLMANNFKAIALELMGRSPYQYRGAFSGGLQEFIEAYTFMEFMVYTSEDDGEERQQTWMSDWQDLEKKMIYAVPMENVQDNPLAIEEDANKPVEKTVTTEDIGNREISFFIDPTEYVLGVADLTGELMRRCINSLGSGETDVCMSTCKMLQQFYAGYVSLYVLRCRELYRKILTMRQSVLKAEQVCYNVKVRGGEAAKWGAMYENKVDDVDEGYY